MKPVELGRWNHMLGSIGPVGSGKTTVLLRHVLDLQQRPGCYVIAHDPNGTLPPEVHGGRRTFVVRHATANGAREQLAKNARGIQAITPPYGKRATSENDANACIALALSVAKASLDAHGGKRGIPVLLLFDEAVAVPGVSPHKLDPAISDLILRRRWHHVGIGYTTQSPKRCHYSLFDNATELYLFRMRSRRDLAALDEGGVPDEVRALLPRLPDHAFLTYYPDRPAPDVGQGSVRNAFREAVSRR
jgi:hypothetical protein